MREDEALSLAHRKKGSDWIQWCWVRQKEEEGQRKTRAKVSHERKSLSSHNKLTIDPT